MFMGLGLRPKNKVAHQGASPPPDHTRDRKADFVLPSAEGQLGYPQDLLSGNGNGSHSGSEPATVSDEESDTSES
jgi:hypothetical protein